MKDRLYFRTKKTDSCWIYTGKSKVRDYGLVWYYGKVILAHRVSWMVHRGDIPKGLCVCHKCDNPPCVNPEHLFLGTYSDNAKDSYLKGRNGFTTHPEGLKRGKDNHQSKLTASKVKEIRRLSSDGYPQYLIGNIFGVSQSNISCIVLRKRWNHVI